MKIKLQTKKVFCVGLAFLIICMFWQVYDNVISKMLINSFGLNQTLSGIVMALDNFLALFLLPIFGALSDKTKSRFGKRTPYVFFGVIASAILFIGVSIFDNLQMKKLSEVDSNYVVTINEDLFNEDNEYYYMVSDLNESEISYLLKYHINDFYYPNNFDDQKIDDLFNLDKIKAKDIDKYFCLTDIELSEEDFNKLVNQFLKDSDLKILKLTREERLAIEDGVRLYQKELNELNKILSEEIFKSENKKDILLEIGVRQFFTVKENATQVRGRVVFEFTKSNLIYLIGFLFILLLTLVAMATYRTPAVSLMPDVTIKPLRSKANAVINLMGTLGGVVSLVLMTFLAKDYHSYMLLFIIISIIMLILLLGFLKTVDENKLVLERVELEKELEIEEEVETTDTSDMSKEVRRSFYLIMVSIIFWFMAYNAATTKFSVYAGDVLNMGYTIPLLIANITAIICFIPIGIIASKIGRKKTILIGIIILFIAFFLGSIARENTKFLIFFTMGIAGIGWATINVNSYPMIVEMSKNSNVGKYTGYYYTASMFAQIITPVLSGLFMDISNTMTVLFPYSVFFTVLAFITMSFVKHGDSKPIAKKNLEAYDD